MTLATLTRVSCIALATLVLGACAGDGAASPQDPGTTTPAERSETPASSDAPGVPVPSGSDSADTTSPEAPKPPESDTPAPPERTYPPQEEQSNHGDAKFDFNYFSVEVLEPPNSPKRIDGVSGIYARTCLHTLPEGHAKTDTLPVHASAWRQEYIPSGTELKRMTEGGHQPAYPEFAELGEGDCVEGYLNFAAPDEEIDGILVYYENSFGARARWSFD